MLQQIVLTRPVGPIVLSLPVGPIVLSLPVGQIVLSPSGTYYYSLLVTTPLGLGSVSHQFWAGYSPDNNHLLQGSH